VGYQICGRATGSGTVNCIDHDIDGLDAAGLGGEGEAMCEGSDGDPRERASDEWLRQQALPAYDAYRADPSRGIALEDVRASIGEPSDEKQSED
jgi:hypothetical protein